MIKKLIKKILGKDSPSESPAGSKEKARGSEKGSGGRSRRRRSTGGTKAASASSAKGEAGEAPKKRRRRRSGKKPTGEAGATPAGRESKSAAGASGKKSRKTTGSRPASGAAPDGEPKKRRRRSRGGRGRARKPKAAAAAQPVDESIDDAVAAEIRAARAEIEAAQAEREGADAVPEEPVPEAAESSPAAEGTPRQPSAATEPEPETASSADDDATAEAAGASSAAQPEPPRVSEDNEFVDLGLDARIAAAVEEKGYQQPTPIQSEAIPVILEGRDVVGSAQTGTGKTAAFALPVLQKLGSHGDLRCLVLGPTRELVQQVGDAFEVYGKYTGLKTAIVYGGVGYGPQREAFARGVDIIVATPGRLLDHLGQKSISLDSVKYLILDEVDRMLDMGFLPDVKRIIQQCPKERQTLFFSATIPPELEKFAEWCLTDPHTIEIGRRRSAAETVKHAFYPVVESQKFDLLLLLLERTNWESVLIFTRTKHGADFVANRLKARGHKVAAMHSNRSQRERTEALDGFKSGKYEVLVATDVAARGLDIRGVTHVINYDTPLHPEDYVHRIGRTGRAQTEGDAFTLLTEDELKYAAAIERFIGQKIERKKVEGFEYKYSRVFESLEGEPDNVFRSRLFRGSRTRR